MNLEQKKILNFFRNPGKQSPRLLPADDPAVKEGQQRRQQSQHQQDGHQGPSGDQQADAGNVIDASLFTDDIARGDQNDSGSQNGGQGSAHGFLQRRGDRMTG